MTPTQDIALGIYYLTSAAQKDRLKDNRRKASGQSQDMEHLPIFEEASEVRLAYDDGSLKVHDRIRFKNRDFKRETVFGDEKSKMLLTTVGRVFFNEILPASLGFINRCCDKSFLGKLIWQCHRTSGNVETVRVLESLKNIGFEHATLAGISIGLSDMIIPPEKEEIIAKARRSVSEVDAQYRRGIITDGERYNKIVDIWTQATDETSTAMYRAIEENVGSEESNPIFMMVDSKARGSRQQIRQLAGMRGLMSKPSGEIIERPIVSNFREGLSVLEYFISTHGARKGLSDTALKTADAGYLTRKLVDVSQDVRIIEQDCNTLNGIEVKAIGEGDESLVSLRDRIIGRTALNDIVNPVTSAVIVPAGTLIDEELADAVMLADVEKARIRSVLTCESRRGTCAKCYGRDLATGKLVEIGCAVGIVAAQSIGEPGTQLTMRTFHIGGTASSVFKQPHVLSKHDGIIQYTNLRVVVKDQGTFVVLNKNGSIGVFDDAGREVERHSMAIGAVVSVADGGRVKKGQSFVEWDPYSVPILAERMGTVHFRGFIENVTVKKEVDQSTGLMGTVVLEHKEDLHPQIVVSYDNNETPMAYNIPAGAHVMVKDGKKVSAGEVLAKTPRKESKTKDITGGLPRVAELFEARRPKDAAEIAKIDGLVDFGPNQRGRRCLIIRDSVTGDEEQHLIPMGKHIVVYKGDYVQKGQQLTEGPIVPQEILEICGPQELQEYLVNQVQEVYRLQGVEINDKHIEIIVRQMLRKVRITDPGDTDFLWGEQVEKQTFQEVNVKAAAEGKRPAEASPALLGITKAALETESFISAASFQDTTRVLTEAATLGRIDTLYGFKENVIMGHLIPGGTGFPMFRNIKLVPLAEPIPEEEMRQESEAEKKFQELIG
jgi:DNA-directed RNA polymerase subunit beta'